MKVFQSLLETLSLRHIAFKDLVFLLDHFIRINIPSFYLKREDDK